MTLLAVDTSAEAASVAVTDGDAVLAELIVTRRGTHSTRLMGMVRTALDAAGVSLADLDGLAVTRGPGSFTGLRIGISTVKGLALAADRPTVGISALDALAYPLSMANDPVWALIDARKGEVYAAAYRFSPDGGVDKGPETVMAPDAVAERITERSVLVGSGARLYRSVFEARLGDRVRFGPPTAHAIRAATVAFLAEARLRDGLADDVAALSPAYIRASDAQIRRVAVGGKAKIPAQAVDNRTFT